LAARSERVLITGATGFTGRLLVGRLRQNGREVMAFSNGADDEGVRNVDLRDFHSLTQAFSQIRPSAVVHLAGIAATDHSDIGEIYSANVVGTANLFGALAAVNIEPQIVVVASSAQVYAAPKDDAPLTEDSPLAPQSHYAVSKRTAEDIARIYSSRFPVIVTRPFNYTGPGQSPSFLVPKIVQHYAEGKSEIRLGNLDLFRDFSDVGRVVEAYYRLVSEPIDPDTINICSGHSVHLTDIPKILEEISGRTIEVITDPSLVRGNEPHVIAGSPSRLETLVGPLPNPEFRETLLHMYEACKRQAGVAR
jgi:nucleoside-diphosphate-sugar epimerase